ncbi:MAG: hypothetical protein Q4P06_02710 [Actinomycetaceae bacterium]|nr:hypothetical protein [Actinomycetaceae bacterium]
MTAIVQGLQRLRRPQEEGEAVVEFLFLTVALIIPIAYFILTVASLQATVFAAESSARESARILSRNWASSELAEKQVETIFADFGIQPPQVLESTCSPQPCASGSLVTVKVETYVEYPLIPTRWLASVVPTIPVTASATMPVEALHVSR